MPEMYLTQLECTYIAWTAFTKNKERIQKFKETGNSKYIYQNELDKDYFQHTAYGDFKDLSRKTVADKILCDKAFNIAKNHRYDGYQRGIALMVYNFFDTKTTLLADKSAAGGAVKK